MNRNAYTALVSELMLQQTQVARVVERFEAFITQFPTAVALAQADEQDVLLSWQGLGYYSPGGSSITGSSQNRGIAT